MQRDGPGQDAFAEKVRVKDLGHDEVGTLRKLAGRPADRELVGALADDLPRPVPSAPPSTPRLLVSSVATGRTLVSTVRAHLDEVVLAVGAHDFLRRPRDRRKHLARRHRGRARPRRQERQQAAARANVQDAAWCRSGQALAQRL